MHQIAIFSQAVFKIAATQEGSQFCLFVLYSDLEDSDPESKLAYNLISSEYYEFLALFHKRKPKPYYLTALSTMKFP